MSLPSSGSLSMSQINVETLKSATATITLNDADVRLLAQKPSGAISISDMYGKSWLTQSDAVSWLQTNRELVNKWTQGGSGDARYSNNPYHVHVSSDSATFTYDLSAASISSSWTTVVITLTGQSPSFSSYTINGGTYTVDSYVETYTSGMRQRILYINTNFKNITSVAVTWNRVSANRGSWANAVVLPGKWTSYSSADPTAGATLASNTLLIGSGYNDGYDSSITAVNGAPSGAARMYFDAWWYNNGWFFFVTNSSGSSVNQTFNSGLGTMYATALTTMSIG
jgi:hypothetical protein